MDPPFFSVVIPTYNRKDHLLRALDALAQQTFPDFEVVVVDQSQPPVEIPEQYKNKLAVRCVYSEERGPALARNKGIKASNRTRRRLLPVDDCIPERDWLEKAARHFDERPIAGLEGRIRSEKLGDPKYRTVSNIDFEGIGFMTAIDILSRCRACCGRLTASTSAFMIFAKTPIWPGASWSSATFRMRVTPSSFIRRIWQRWNANRRSSAPRCFVSIRSCWSATLISTSN